MVYLDNAATTPVRPEAADAARSAMLECWGNPSSAHAAGQAARRVLDESRETVAASLGCQPEEVIFTSSATEAANLAIKGYAASFDSPHMVISAVEHHCVADSARHVADVDVARVDAHGRLDLNHLMSLLREDTALVCVQAANNEIGTTQDLLAVKAAFAGLTNPPLLFVDAVQAFGKIPLETGDLTAISGHKFGAPKGVGVLAVRRGIKLHPQTHGGGQERSRRSGTENVPGAAAIAAAASAAHEEFGTEPDRLRALRDRLIKELLTHSGVALTGHPSHRTPHVASVAIEGIQSPEAVILMDQCGVCVSGGAACHSGAQAASDVLAACGITDAPLRFSLGWASTDDDVTRAAEAFEATLRVLRP